MPEQKFIIVVYFFIKVVTMVTKPKVRISFSDDFSLFFHLVIFVVLL